jgi:tRNA(adenine34) deaminase
MAKNTTLSSTAYERFMLEALKEARLAFNEDEVPVGAVIEYRGEVFAKGHNRRIGKNSSIAHAEMEAIEEASRKHGDWRLEGMTLYVTSEPCIMCAGAAIHSRIGRVVYGCMEPKMGAAGSICNVFDIDKLHHKPEVLGGVLENECSAVLTEFFEKLRDKK